MFVHEGTRLHRYDGTTLDGIALYNGVENVSDQPVVGDHLVYVNTANQFVRVHRGSGTSEAWSPPTGTTAASVRGRPGQARTLAEVNGTGTYQLVDFPVHGESTAGSLHGERSTPATEPARWPLESDLVAPSWCRSRGSAGCLPRGSQR